jgi:hypothetical protein
MCFSSRPPTLHPTTRASQVRPELLGQYEVNAPLYVSEEEERADRWDGFLSRGEDGSSQTPEKPATTTHQPAAAAATEMSADGGGTCRRSLDMDVGTAVPAVDAANVVVDASEETNAATASGGGGDDDVVDKSGGSGGGGGEITSNSGNGARQGGSGTGNGSGDVWGRHSLNAVVAILEGRAPGRSGPEAPHRERELQALVHGGVPRVGGCLCCMHFTRSA